MKNTYLFDYLYLSIYKINKFINISLINSVDVETSIFLSFLYGSFFSIKLVSIFSINKKISLLLLVLFAVIFYKLMSTRYHRINDKKLKKDFNYIYFIFAVIVNVWIILNTYNTIVKI